MWSIKGAVNSFVVLLFWLMRNTPFVGLVPASVRRVTAKVQVLALPFVSLVESLLPPTNKFAAPAP